VILNALRNYRHTIDGVRRDEYEVVERSRPERLGNIADGLWSGASDDP
jgi:hypothetical protein